MFFATSTIPTVAIGTKRVLFATTIVKVIYFFNQIKIWLSTHIDDKFFLAPR